MTHAYAHGTKQGCWSKRGKTDSSIPLDFNVLCAAQMDEVPDHRGESRGVYSWPNICSI